MERTPVLKGCAWRLASWFSAAIFLLVLIYSLILFGQYLLTGRV